MMYRSDLVRYYGLCAIKWANIITSFCSENSIRFLLGERDIIRLYFGSSYRNVNRRDEAGNTALFIAAYNGECWFSRVVIVENS